MSDRTDRLRDHERHERHEKAGGTGSVGQIGGWVGPFVVFVSFVVKNPAIGPSPRLGRSQINGMAERLEEQEQEHAGRRVSPHRPLER
jgi:hypothetical protein